MIRNLGQVLTVLVLAEVNERSMHEEVHAWGAPSECHNDVSRNEHRRARLARKQAEALAHRPLRCIMKEAKRRGFNEAVAFNRLYQRHGFPF